MTCNPSPTASPSQNSPRNLRGLRRRTRLPPVRAAGLIGAAPGRPASGAFYRL